MSQNRQATHHKGGPKGHPHKKEAQPVEFEGTIRINARGFGYVSREDSDEDVEIPPELLNTALHRDRVKAITRPKRHDKRIRGEITEIVQRSSTRFVGTLEEEGGYLFVRPDDHRVYMDFIVDRESSAEATVGEKVAVDLIRWNNPHKNPLVHIAEVLGKAGLHETEMRSVVAAQGFDWRFPAEVETVATDLHNRRNEILSTPSATRKDFRGTPTFTIDPYDAKDFDDAVSVRFLDDGRVELGVHIADVSAFVEKDQAIDKEAQKRGTSIYLVDRTIPMLPEVLSNDLCSLRPDEDRFAFSAVFTMTKNGEVQERWFGETLIRSDRRFTYQDAQDILSAGQGELYDELLAADTIARALRKQRFQNGSIGFETDEIKFELDNEGRPVRAFRKERLDTMLMIEDLMLLANREVATFAWNAYNKDKKACVFVWRIHDSPKPERIEDLALFLKMLGYELIHKDGEVSPGALNRLFDEIEGKPEQEMIETAAIRSMAKAVYSMKNIGHFGLAFDFYTHFTSPIRRYPDLMVHRIMKQILSAKPPTTREYPYYERLAQQSSDREVAAMEAERDSIKLKQVEYMAERIGQEFSGIVTGIHDFGLFIEEVESMAEGLAHVRTMRDDRYELRDHGFRLVGESTGKTYSLGDSVRVTLKGVDIERKSIDWQIVAEN